VRRYRPSVVQKLGTRPLKSSAVCELTSTGLPTATDARIALLITWLGPGPAPGSG
jgi:hypothetical protein